MTPLRQAQNLVKSRRVDTHSEPPCAAAERTRSRAESDVPRGLDFSRRDTRRLGRAIDAHPARPVRANAYDLARGGTVSGGEERAAVDRAGRCKSAARSTSPPEGGRADRATPRHMRRPCVIRYPGRRELGTAGHGSYTHGSSYRRAAGPDARVAREPGQSLTAAAISGSCPVPSVSWSLADTMNPEVRAADVRGQPGMLICRSDL